MNDSSRGAPHRAGFQGSFDPGRPPSPSGNAFPGRHPHQHDGPARPTVHARGNGVPGSPGERPGASPGAGGGDGHRADGGREVGPSDSVPCHGTSQDGGTAGPGTAGDGSPAGGPTRHDAGVARGARSSGAPTGADSGGKKRAGRDLRAAIGVGSALGAVVLASLFVYKPVFLGVIVLAVVVGLWELTTRLSECKGIHVPLVPLASGGAAMALVGYRWGADGAWVAMALTVLVTMAWRMTHSPEEYLRDTTAAVFAAFYVPFLATFVALMLAADDGAERVLVFLVLTVVSDTGAYAVGWRFGRRKLAPRISPGKTLEGLLGAVTFAMAAGAVCLHFLVDEGNWWQGLLLGLAVAASATLGDLAESMIKRDLGIKDMGALLPGHGGIMDRLDSLLPTAPVVWLLLVVFAGTS